MQLVIMLNKKVLIIGTHDYLSIPILNRIINSSLIYEKYKIDVLVSFPYHTRGWELFKTKTSARINSFLIIKEHFVDVPILRHLVNLLWIKLHLYRIPKNNYDKIISFSDLSHVFQFALRWFKSDFYLIQPSHFETNKDEKMINGNRGLIFDILFGLVHSVKLKNLYWGNTCDNIHLLLWGNHFRPYFNKNREISMIGNLSLPALFNKRDVYISLFDEPGTVRTIDLRKIYKSLVYDNPEFEFILKLHPYDNNVSEIIEYFASLSNLTIIHDEKSSIDILSESILSISRNSATSYEAIYMGVPVIIPLPDEITYRKFGHDIFLKAADLSETKSFLIDYLSGKTSDFEINRIKFMSIFLNHPNDPLESLYKVLEKKIQNI